MSEVAPSGFGTAGCHSCQLANRGDLPPRDRIYADGRWQVAHAFDSALLGWLILFPVRHLTSLSELTDDEAAGLGILQHRLSQTLIDAVGCAKIYSILLAEAEGFAHLHFHIVPRHADIPAEFRGPRVFGYLGRADSERVSDEDMDALARRLQTHPALSRTGLDRRDP